MNRMSEENKITTYDEFKELVIKEFHDFKEKNKNMEQNEFFSKVFTECARKLIEKGNSLNNINLPDPFSIEKFEDKILWVVVVAFVHRELIEDALKCAANAGLVPSNEEDISEKLEKLINFLAEFSEVSLCKLANIFVPTSLMKEIEDGFNINPDTVH